jgi:DNA-binding transcriptional regulator YiaG
MKKGDQPAGSVKARRNRGDEIVEGLRELVEVLRSGEPLESRFTVRTYKIAPPPEYHGEGVRRVRELLAMSQAAFAAFLGADASTVQSWEQDLRPPNPLACRMLSEIEADPTHWRKRLAACLIGPETRGPDAQTEARPRPTRRTRAVGRTK